MMFRYAMIFAYLFTEDILEKLNFNSSNTGGSFTMVNSNSFLSPYDFFPIAQENKYLGTS